MSALSTSDLEAVARQLGREPTTELEVVARCPGGHPLVIRNHPLDRGGHPFPTLYWLTCPEAVKRIARLESEGWIDRLEERLEAEPELRAAVEAAHRDYAAEREGLHAGAGALGGVGGTEGPGLKCLHAHYAHHLAGGENPVGAWVAERVEPVHRPTPDRVAAVDMGTNSIRLLVADPQDADLTEIARDMVITRMGKGMDRSGRFDPGALDRTLRVLERYVRRARALGAGRIRVGATSAARDAENRDLLVAEVERIVGEPPEILTGEREGALSFVGATAGLEADPPFLVFDIGGGSTELVLGDDEPRVAASLNLGSVRAHERVGPADPPTPEDIEELDAVVAEGLAEAEDAVPVREAATVIGVAGTTTTVQALALGLDRYDPDRIHRTELTREAAEEVADRLAGMTVAERGALPVMAPGREDVIVAGARILAGILRTWGFERCLVSETDILDGLALEAVARTER